MYIYNPEERNELIYLFFQVVSGISYTLTIELVDTDCLRNENVDRSKCKPDSANGNLRTCTVRIWDQPWLNSKQIRDPDCDVSGPEVESRSLKTAGITRENMTLSPEDEDVKIAANFALARLDAFDDNFKKRVLIKVIEAASHVSYFNKKKITTTCLLRL